MTRTASHIPLILLTAIAAAGAGLFTPVGLPNAALLGTLFILAAAFAKTRSRQLLSSIVVVSMIFLLSITSSNKAVEPGGLLETVTQLSAGAAILVSIMATVNAHMAVRLHQVREEREELEKQRMALGLEPQAAIPATPTHDPKTSLLQDLRSLLLGLGASALLALIVTALGFFHWDQPDPIIGVLLILAGPVLALSVRYGRAGALSGIRSIAIILLIAIVYRVLA